MNGIAHYLWSFPRAQEVWVRNFRILARCRVEVQVSRVTVVWLVTKSVAWFHGWNGNSRAYYTTFISKRFILHIGRVSLTVWQVRISRCNESFTGKRTTWAESFDDLV